MRLLLLPACLLFLCSCMNGKPQYMPPVVEVEEPRQAEIELTSEKTAPSVVEKTVSYPEDSFTALLITEGPPTENIIPRSKEQVAIYDKGNVVSFYYFVNSKLVRQKNFPRQQIEMMKANAQYPQQPLQEIGAID